MKIKHWQGYGSVTATKKSKTTRTNSYGYKHTTLVVEVKGMHEWGLLTDDDYTLYNWLIKRFDKNVADYYKCNPMHTAKSNYVKGENGLDIEVVTYQLIYRADEK